MLYEDLRYVHEDIERLEQAIADRVLDDPKLVSHKTTHSPTITTTTTLAEHPLTALQIRNRLVRDHEIATFLNRIHDQSQHGLHLYNDEREARTQEMQAITSNGPQFDFSDFDRRLDEIKNFHKRYPNEPVENLERAYKRADQGGPGEVFAGNVDGMFTGEEAFGRFFDLTMLHEEYINLPGVKGSRKLTYLQYLDIFDAFTLPKCPITRQDKLTDEYFSYVTSLAEYLEGFMRRAKPLQDLDKMFKDFDAEFEQLWQNDEAPGWSLHDNSASLGASKGTVIEGTGEGVWCADCQKEFKNDNVYKAHLTGKKHIKNAEARTNGNGVTAQTNGTSVATATARLKERALAEREHRIRKLASTMQTEREDTRVNVERKAGMTDRERQQELAALYAEDEDALAATNGNTGDGDDDEEEKVYNPLKLPLAWDGKPIPFWLYKLHGLGVEFPCEICGNYVYMGRRAFEKHFSEARHVHGLKCLGITQTSLFREITGIEEAQRLWEKIQRERAKVVEKKEDVVEMEDSMGNVMPEKVYRDLEKMGML